MRHGTFALASALVGLSACVADPVQNEQVVKTPFHPDAPPRGLSENGVDYGAWGDPFLTNTENQKVDQRFAESVEQLLNERGDTGLVNLLQSEGFKCVKLLDSISPTIWHCRNVVVYQVPMSIYTHWEWMVTVWEDKIRAGHFSVTRLY